jgi:hypothetical protein
MNGIGPTGPSGRNATPQVVLEVAMNSASIPMPVDTLVIIPFNFLVFGNELGTQAFNPLTTVITIPLTGTYRIFLNVTFLNTSNDTADNELFIRAFSNSRSLLITEKMISGTLLPVAGRTSVQSSVVCGLVRGDIITFAAEQGIVAGVTSLQGVAVPKILPFPVTASVESFF